MRSLHGLLFAALAWGQCNPAMADSTVNYSFGGGRTSNVFKDTTALPASFGEGKVALRGSFDLEDSQFAYALTASVRRLARYRFADERTVGLETGFTHELAEGVRLTLKGGIEQRRDGDIFLTLPGLLIGYRKADVAASASADLTVDHAGGKSHVTAALSNLNRGLAEFTLPGLPRTQLEAGYRLATLTAGHILPLFGGELGATVEARTNNIPSNEQQVFERFPATTLRGSLAYGHAFGPVTLMAEAGLQRVSSDALGTSVDPVRPYLKAELAFRLPRETVLKATFLRDIQLADIDDPLGEDVRTIGLSLETALTEKLKLTLGYEEARSDWLYYDYRTRTRSVKAAFTYTFAKSTAVTLEYSRLLRHETDPAADFTVDGLAARLSGTF